MSASHDDNPVTKSPRVKTREHRTNEKGKSKRKPALRVHRVWRLYQIVYRIVVKGWQKSSGSGCQSSSTHVLQGVAPIHHTLLHRQ